MPIRLIIIFTAFCCLTFSGLILTIGLDMNKPIPKLRRSICIWLYYVGNCFLTYLWPVTVKINEVKCDYSEWLGADQEGHL